MCLRARSARKVHINFGILVNTHTLAYFIALHLYLFRLTVNTAYTVDMGDFEKKWQDVTLCKKVSAFSKKYFFSDRNARKYSKSKIDFKNVFLRVFRHFDSQCYIFLLNLRLFYIRHVIFRLRFARVQGFHVGLVRHYFSTKPILSLFRSSISIPEFFCE